MTYTCPKGHESEANDFCSECGAKMGSAPKLASVAPPPPAPGACPDCGSARSEDFGVFCEVCGYNFNTGAHGQIPLPPISEPIPEAAPPQPPPPPPAVPLVSDVAWTLIATTDPALKAEESPDPPANFSELTFHVDKDVSLIGRRSDVRGITPELALDFNGAVSHRHALLTRKPDGALMLRDVGSSNGTRVNGAEVKAMTDVPLQDGDRITLGYWTALKVEKR